MNEWMNEQTNEFDDWKYPLAYKLMDKMFFQVLKFDFGLKNDTALCRSDLILWF